MKRLGCAAFLFFAPFLLFFVLFLVLSSGEEGEDVSPKGGAFSASLSPEVERYRSQVVFYAKKAGLVDEDVAKLLALMQVESGGLGADVMQVSEAYGMAPNTIQSPTESIEKACRYFAKLKEYGKRAGILDDTIFQAYNFGEGFIDYVAVHGKKYSYELAEAFARDMAQGERVVYLNPVAVAKNGGFRYNYGNQFYVLVLRGYLAPDPVDDVVVQKVLAEAYRYEGYPYVFGGASPATSFDCSGLVAWCFAKAGVAVPRLADEQYDATIRISREEARPGDLVFFQGTYACDSIVTHVGIYVGNGRMFHAGNPIQFAYLDVPYWVEHFYGFGRVKR